MAKISIQQKINELSKDVKSTHKCEKFDRDKLISCWGEYCESIKTSKINLYSILINSTIDIKNEKDIEITIDGPMKKAEIDAERNHIIQSMRNILKNDDIMLLTKMIEKEKIKTNISDLAQEKLNSAIENNPEVSMFIDTFNLNPEM